MTTSIRTSQTRGHDPLNLDVGKGGLETALEACRRRWRIIAWVEQRKQVGSDRFQ